MVFGKGCGRVPREAECGRRNGLVGAAGGRAQLLGPAHGMRCSQQRTGSQGCGKNVRYVAGVVAVTKLRALNFHVFCCMPEQEREGNHRRCHSVSETKMFRKWGETLLGPLETWVQSAAARTGLMVITGIREPLEANSVFEGGLEWGVARTLWRPLLEVDGTAGYLWRLRQGDRVGIRSAQD